jgi:hypothetical protein
MTKLSNMAGNAISSKWGLNFRIFIEKPLSTAKLLLLQILYWDIGNPYKQFQLLKL